MPSTRMPPVFGNRTRYSSIRWTSCFSIFFSSFKYQTRSARSRFHLPERRAARGRSRFSPTRARGAAPDRTATRRPPPQIPPPVARFAREARGGDELFPSLKAIQHLFEPVDHRVLDRPRLEC